jgi:acetolactate synthase I/II/III large subunit
MDARSTSNTQTHSAAYFLLEGLKEIGVDYLFCNFGTDHAPIIEELANRKQRGEPVPKTIRCAHENTAAHMAAGYALMTGRGQGVLVHVDVGTANTANAMHNLFRSRLPVLLMAGKAPYTTAHELTGTRDTYVHFVQEPFDQGSLVRPYVKWEWTLPSGVVVKEALRRAHTIMQSEPRGPVYLMMARETLAADWDEADIRRYPADQFAGAASSAADPELITQLAGRILAAQNPMLITAYAGRNPDASRAIEELAEFAGIAIYESNFVNNISHEGPCFLGFVPDKHLPEADLGLLVDIDVPWFPRDVQPKEGSYWAQIDVDVLKTASPMWTFPSSLRLQGDSARILTQLLAKLKEIAPAKFREAAAARVKSFEKVRTARTERAKQLAADKGKLDEINPHYLFAELAKLIEPTDIVFNEAVRNSGALALQIPRPLPGTMSRVGGGGLGSSGGMALGAKLAAPDRMMIQVVGDGSFYFNCPSSVFAAAKQYRLPFLSIVLDNTGWSAVKESTLRVFPEGKAKETKEFEAELSPDVDFAKVGEAFGAYGEKVSDPAEVPAALKRCVEAVRGGRAAVLHARVTRI